MPTVMLYEIEQELANRVGPYILLTTTSGSNSSFVSPQLLSNMLLGDPWTGLFCYRRGFLANTPPTLANFNPNDAIRRVSAYIASTGTISVDAPWATPPVVGETIELHYLWPDRELRSVVLAGLDRCYLMDRVSVPLTGPGAERDITQLAPFITSEQQVYEASWTYPGAVYVPRPQWWWQTFTQGGDVWLRSWPDPFPNTLALTIRRQASSFVNGGWSPNGPTNNTDQLSVDLAYAAAAAHVEAWRRLKVKLTAGAQVGNQVTQAEAAAEFTRLAKANFKPLPRRSQMPGPFPVYASGVP